MDDSENVMMTLIQISEFHNSDLGNYEIHSDR